MLWLMHLCIISIMDKFIRELSGQRARLLIEIALQNDCANL